MGNLRQNLLSLGNRIQMSKKLLEVAESRYKTSKIEFNANRISANRHLESKIALDKVKSISWNPYASILKRTTFI